MGRNLYRPAESPREGFLSNGHVTDFPGPKDHFGGSLGGFRHRFWTYLSEGKPGGEVGLT